MRVPALGDSGCNPQRAAWPGRARGLGLLAVCVAAGLAVGVAASIAHPLVLLALPPALAVAIWALSSAERALWLLIAVIAILPRVASPVSIGFKPTLLDVALLLLIAAWAARTSRYPLDLRRLPISLPLIGLMVVALATFVFGLPNGPFTTLVARRFAEMLLSLGAVFVIVAVLRDVGAIRRATAVFALAGGLAALIGLALYVMPDDLAIRLLSALRIFDYPAGPGVLRYIRDDPALMQRATGLWIDPNAYGGFLLVVGALTLPQVFAARPALPRWLALLCAGLIGLALVASVSRGAMLGFVAVAALIGAARYRRLFVLGAVALAVALLLPQTSELAAHFVDGFMGRDLATQMRFGEYRDALRLLERYPVLGVGFTDTPDVDLYIGVSMMYLLIAQTMGGVGLTAFLAVMATLFVSAGRAASKVWSNEELFPAWLGAHAAIVGVLISGIFDHYFFNIDFHNAVMLMWLVVALAAAASRLAGESGVKDEG